MTLKFWAVLFGVPALAGLAPAQQVISIKAGLVNYVEGKVLLDSKPVELKFGNFPSVRNGSELQSQEGRAEVLLGPGVFLRMGEASSFRMVSDRITDTRLELLSGSMIVECGDMDKDAPVTILHKDASVTLVKNGVYRLDADPARLMVYDGEARVAQGGQTQNVKKSKMLTLDGVAVAEKFDNKTGDALFRWAYRRSESLSVANLSAARSVARYGSSYSSNGWIYNPYFGMYTYLPYNGVYNSFWGYSYWSPRQVNEAYYSVPRHYAGGGSGSTPSGRQTYTRIPATSAGTSGSVARSSPPTASGNSSGTHVSRQTVSVGPSHGSGGTARTR